MLLNMQASLHYKAKKLLKKLGLHYNKIYVCHNYCMLYWEDVENKEGCKSCKRFGWKHNGHETANKHNLINEKQQKNVLNKSFMLLFIDLLIEKMFMS